MTSVRDYDVCATCDHEARHHWVRIVAPLDGECERGACACTRFVAEPGEVSTTPDTADNTVPTDSDNTRHLLWRAASRVWPEGDA